MRARVPLILMMTTLLAAAGGLFASGAPQAPPAAAVSAAPVARQAVTAAGYIYVSTITPRDTSAAAGIESQTADVLAQLQAVLETQGSRVSQLCSVTVSLRSESDFDAMNTAYRRVFPDADGGENGPPARTTFATWLPPHTLIQISAVAVPNGAARRTRQPPKWAKNSRPYSYIVETDDLVFFAGLVARRGETDTPVTGPVRTQVETILDNAGTLLDTVGLSYDDVVSARVYVATPLDYDAMNAVYGAYFSKNAPARSTAVTALVTSGADVEIALIASKQPKTIVGGAAASGVPVSVAVQAGPRVWLSAVIGDTVAHPRDAAAQMRDALARQQATLALAGLTPSDVVDATVYVHDYDDWAKVDPVARTFFPVDPPARTAVPTRLVVDAASVQVAMAAVRRGHSANVPQFPRSR